MPRVEGESIPRNVDLSSDEHPERKLQHGCGRCSARWNGKKTAHCGSCHETFSGPSAFDQHRVGGTCVQADAATMLRYLLARQERAGYVVWGCAGADERWDNEDGDEDE